MEVRAGIHILQSQDGQRVEELAGLFEGINTELSIMSNRVSDNKVQFLAIKGMKQYK